jgi:translocation protein SEC62
LALPNILIGECIILCRYQKRVSNIIDDVLEWDPRLAISGMMEKQSVFNETEPSNATDEEVIPPAGVGAKTIIEQDEEDVSEILDSSDENLDNSDEQKHDHI